jgi:type II secretion system protein N
VRKAALAFIALSVFVVGLWVIALPESLLKELIEHSLGSDTLYLQSEGLKKGFFYRFRAERIVLKKIGAGSNSGDTLLVFQDVHFRLKFRSLLRLSPEVGFRCRLNQGDVVGDIHITGKRNARVNGTNILIQGIPSLESLGIRGEGMLSGNLEVNNREGEMKLSVTDARLNSTSLGGVFLPLELFHTIKGAAGMSDGIVTVRSFTLEGRGVYARVKGSARGRDLNMNFELMADSSFSSGPVLSAMMEQYKVSPGYYVIPLRGMLL